MPSSSSEIGEFPPTHLVGSPLHIFSGSTALLGVTVSGVYVEPVEWKHRTTSYWIAHCKFLGMPLSVEEARNWAGSLLETGAAMPSGVENLDFGKLFSLQQLASESPGQQLEDKKVAVKTSSRAPLRLVRLWNRGLRNTSKSARAPRRDGYVIPPLLEEDDVPNVRD